MTTSSTTIPDRVEHIFSCFLDQYDISAIMAALKDGRLQQDINFQFQVDERAFSGKFGVRLTCGPQLAVQRHLLVTLHHPAAWLLTTCDNIADAMQHSASIKCIGLECGATHVDVKRIKDKSYSSGQKYKGVEIKFVSSRAGNDVLHMVLQFLT